MTKTVREGVAGGAAAAVLVAAGAGLGMPLWGSFLLASGVYAGLRLVLPARPNADEVRLAEGVTAQQLEEFLRPCRAHLAEIDRLTPQIPAAGFRAKVQQLRELLGELVRNFEKDPEDIRYAGPFPRHLERLSKTLRGYVDLANRRYLSDSARAALGKSEDMVASAGVHFEEMLHQLIERDVIALETSSRALRNVLN